MGSPILTVIAKKTYNLIPNQTCTPSDTQLPLLAADAFFENGDPVTASCEFESDFIPYKPFVDIVLNGKAHAPGGKAVPSLTISEYTKSIVVFGNRRCRHRPSLDPVWSDPEPFIEMDLRYERAYGGVDIHSREDNGALIYPRNPLGRGYVASNRKEAIDGLHMPNLEEPGNLLTPSSLIVEKPEDWQHKPLPQSFGWYGKSWFPRCTYAGVMPEHASIYQELREASLGYVPSDLIENFKKLKLPMMNFRFFNGAPVDMQLEGIAGDESITLTGMDSQGDFSFELPEDTPCIAIDIGNGFQTPPVHVQTVCILKEQFRLYMVWRASLPYPGPERMHELPTLAVHVEA